MILIWMYPKIVKQSPLNHLHDGLAIANDTFVEVRHIVCCNLGNNGKIVNLMSAEEEAHILRNAAFQLETKVYIFIIFHLSNSNNFG